MSESKQFLFAIALVAALFAVILLAIDWLTDPRREPWTYGVKLAFVVGTVVVSAATMYILAAK